MNTMSKLIVEMEMPSICCECVLCVLLDNSGRGYCKAVKGNAMFREMELDPNKRPSWCPIEGVLPDEHGDLIDMDEVKNEIMKRMPQWCSTDEACELWTDDPEKKDTWTKYV